MVFHGLLQVTTKVSKPVDIPPPPTKKTRPLIATPRSKAVRLSVPWANGAICTPAPEGDVTGLEEEEVNEDEDVGVEVFENGSDKESVYQQVRSVNLIETVLCNLSLWGSFSNSAQFQKTTCISFESEEYIV